MMRLTTSILFTIFISVQQTLAVDVICSRQTNVWSPFGFIPECLAYNVISKEPKTALESVDSYSDLSDYISFYIYQSPECFFLPTGIAKKFPNLEVLVAAHTGLRSISKEDLKPFGNLKGLYIDYSKITTIPADLFVYNQNLEDLSLQQNGIKVVEPSAFRVLTKLVSFSFDKNECLGRNEKGRTNVEKLFEDVYKNCKDQANELPELSSGETDYVRIIEAIENKKNEVEENYDDEYYN